MVPPVTDPRWRSAVTGATAFQPKMLATQILMGRLRMTIQYDQSPTGVARAIDELRGFFVKNEAIAASDLAQIFG